MNVKIFDETGFGIGSKALCYGVDLYNQRLSGQVACSLTASMGVPAHTGPKVIILNDQGGSVMDVASIAGCLRAQDHGHPPVVCFEPGIMSRDSSAGNRAYLNICSTLRAEMGDNRPAVCYENDS